jgi:uncharacterized membrane protein
VVAVTNAYTRVLAIIAAVGAGLSAGVYFAFSTLVMGGSPAHPVAGDRPSPRRK